MLFAPHVKSKRRDDSKRIVQPFPVCENQAPYDGTFTGLSVEVTNKSGITALFTNGCFGKGSHSRSVPNALLPSTNKMRYENDSECKETLSLGLEEAFFLSYIAKVLRIYNLCGEQLKCQNFLKEALAVNSLFPESLAAYIYLKSKGWVVKSGMKFGGNFLIYRKGPSYFHASFVVIVASNSYSHHFRPSTLKCFQRIAETSNKDVLVLEVSKPPNHTIDTIERMMDQFKIAENIIRRFNYNSFVQHPSSSIK